MTRRGFFGSSSIAARMREICTSIERSNASSFSFFSASMMRVARHHAAGMLRQHQQQRELIAGQRARLAVELSPAARRCRSPAGRNAARRISAPPRRGAGSLSGAPAVRAARTAWADNRRRRSQDRPRGPWRRRARSASGSASASRARSLRQTSSPSMSGSIRSRMMASKASRLCRLETVRAGRRDRHVEAGPAEIAFHHLGKDRVVFDQQDRGHSQLYRRSHHCRSAATKQSRN